MVGVVKHGIGDTLPHEHAGDGGNGVIQTFDVLDIHRCVDIDACFQKLLDILIPFGVAAAVCIGVGQFIHKNELRVPRNCGINVKLL